MSKKKRKKRRGNVEIKSSTLDIALGSQRHSRWLPGALTFALTVAMVVFVLTAAASSAAARKKKEPPTKTVSGFVLDEADNGVPGAAVELSDQQTGKKIAAYSKEGGRYQFTGLDPHHDYEVKALYKGVASEVRQVSSVDERKKMVINLTIPGLKLK